MEGADEEKSTESKTLMAMHSDGDPVPRARHSHNGRSSLVD